MINGIRYDDNRHGQGNVKPCLIFCPYLKDVLGKSGNIFANITPDKIEIPQEMEEMKPIVQAVVEVATSTPTAPTSITSEYVAGQTYTETITEEKITTYEGANNIMCHMARNGDEKCILYWRQMAGSTSLLNLRVRAVKNPMR